MTFAVFVVLFTAMTLAFEGFGTPLSSCYLLISYAHVGILAMGMTFVILSGGIDLSVGTVLAFTTVFIAKAVSVWGLSPWVAIPVALFLGAGFGGGMGFLIHQYKMPPFLVTLAGMFLARGLAFVVNIETISLSEHPFFRAVSSWKLYLAPASFTPRPFLKAEAIIFLVLVVFCLYLAHMRRFGRTVYAIGGSESSATLMGLKVARTKILVYAFSGFCAALAGVAFTFLNTAGKANMGIGWELDAIAAVVIGGTLLTGGSGYVLGTFLGVLIYGSIMTGVGDYSNLGSAGQRISIGVLLLLFILVQGLLPGAGKTRSS